jgi:succinyl-CoA synthetase beta subunit
LQGTNFKIAKEMIDNSGLKLYLEEDLDKAAEKVVELGKN